MPLELSPLDLEDEIYVRARFVPLLLLAQSNGWDLKRLRSSISARKIPEPTYILPDGTEMVPADYFSMFGDGANLDTFRERFVTRYETASLQLGNVVSDADSDETWNAYLTGLFGACIKSISPEAMALKQHLISSIEILLADPEIETRWWRTALKDAVSNLDALEMPFAGNDEARFGARSSRHRYIDEVRTRFPVVFQGDAQC